MKVRLSEMSACFQGVIPSMLATCSASGEPNVTSLSHVYLVDDRHVALSCQFFNKTRRNIAENPHATVIVYDPLKFEGYKLGLKFVRSETSGPLFDTMSLRIDAIASHTGMAGVFKLISSDVFEVQTCRRIEGFLLPAEIADTPPKTTVPGPLTELRGLQVVSQRIARAKDLDGLLASTLEALDELLGFQHSMVLVNDDCTQRLVAIASRGYGPGSIGAEVAVGHGLIGKAAERRRMIKLTGLGTELRYGRAIRERHVECGESERLAPEVPLAGLADAQAQLALPLVCGERLVGVLAVESRDPLCFDDWDEAFLQIVASQIAMALDRMQENDEEEPADEVAPAPAAAPQRVRNFVFYRNDDCVFVDGEYLVRNIPGKILWKLLSRRAIAGQREFTNRELRLDPALGLPALKDNLESRLILLRKRLAEKCPEVRIVPVRRGRFALELDCAVELSEKDCG
ncbi:MAG: GAF domain-containing protein [Planctomycetota bacterium]|nr:GAF domain-containing protein [Planctomycetota bacterium]